MNLTKSKSGNYHASYRDATGKTRTLTTRTADREEAKRIVRASNLKQLESIARSDRLTHEAVVRLTAGKRMTIQAAFDKWSAFLTNTARSPRTAQNAIDSTRQWIEATDCGSRPTTSITDEDIDHWINDPKSANKALTRQWLRSGLSRFFWYCATQNWVLKNPVDTVPIRFPNMTHQQRESTPRAIFTEAEYHKMLTAFKQETAYTGKAIELLNPSISKSPRLDSLARKLDSLRFWEFAVRISYDIGLRLGDICQLEWACFETPGYATVWTDKRDRRIHVPISESLYDFLSTIPIASSKYVFPNERLIHLDPKARSILSVNFKRLLTKWGIKGKTFHCLRHTRCSIWRKEGISLEQIAKDVGHTNVATTKKYIHA